MIRFLILFLFFVYITNAQNTVSINNPVANQVLTPGKSVAIKYIILGRTPNSSNTQASSFPLSMDIVFRWYSTNSSQKPLELNARKNLCTDPFPGGLKDQSYHQYWKAPAQSFFNQYKPAQWKFSLVFQPKYPTLSTVSTLNGQVTQQQQPQKREIIIPLEIQSSNTLMKSDYHTNENKPFKNIRS